MDIEMFDELHQGVPKFNKKILEGVAYTELQDAKSKVDRLIHCAERSFPEDFYFNGSRVCDPAEAYRYMAQFRRIGDSKIDLAPSDMVLVAYDFTGAGHKLTTKYFFLPCPEKGNFIKIADKVFTLTPVMADPGFSVGEGFVFVKMNRAPVNFRREIYTVIGDGEILSKYVAHAKLHNKAGNPDRKHKSDRIYVGRVLTTIPHYLFCKYGLVETFNRYCGTEIRVGLETDHFDPKIWFTYQSNKLAPSGIQKAKNYQEMATKVVFAVERDKRTHLTDTLAAGLFYTLDHFPTDIEDPQDLLDPITWKLWLAYILSGDELGHGKLIENIETHLKNLDNYVDSECKAMLYDEEGLLFEDIYDLSAYIQEHIDEMLRKRGKDAASSYGKRLVVANYVLRDIYEQIFKFVYEITKNRKRQHTATDYNKSLGRYFIPEKIHELRNTSMKPYVSSTQTPTDNMYFGITDQLVMQSRTGAGQTSKDLNIRDPSCILHASAAEVGNYTVLMKSCPLAKNTINVTTQLNESNTIIPKDSMKRTVAYIDKILKAR